MLLAGLFCLKRSGLCSCVRERYLLKSRPTPKWPLPTFFTKFSFFFLFFFLSFYLCTPPDLTFVTAWQWHNVLSGCTNLTMSMACIIWQWPVLLWGVFAWPNGRCQASGGLGACQGQVDVSLFSLGWRSWAVKCHWWLSECAHCCALTVFQCTSLRQYVYPFSDKTSVFFIFYFNKNK